MGLKSEVATKDLLTYPFKNSHPNLLDWWAKKLLTAVLVKFEQRGMLVNYSRKVCCCRQREIR